MISKTSLKQQMLLIMLEKNKIKIILKTKEIFYLWILIKTPKIKNKNLQKI